MKKNKIITIIVFALMILITSFVLIKTDLPSKLFKADVNDIVLQDNEAMFKPGRNVNVIMKTLSGNANPENTFDENIIKVQRSNALEITPTEDNIVSIDSGKPIYMWFKNGTIYYYTEATKIYLHSYSDYFFFTLKKLETIDLSDFDTSKVTNMGAMFDQCESLTKVILGDNFDTSKVTSMWRMFYECKSLETLDTTLFKFDNVENISEMFYMCSKLSNIKFRSDINTSKLKYMAGTFAYCTSLTSIDLNNFESDSLSSISELFRGCNSLTSIDISNINTSKVTDMKYLFDSCRNLTNIIFGDNFDTKNVTNMHAMFQNCISLTNINLSTFNTGNVTDMGWMFGGCENLSSLDLSKFTTTKLKNMSCIFYNCKALTTINLSTFNTSNVTEMNQIFSNCESLIEIIFGGNFNTSKVTNMASMFFNCKKLASINLSTFDTSNVEYMSSMFSKCESLINLNLSNFNTKKVVYMPGMFSGCKALKNITFGKDFDVKNATDISAMFNKCSSLTSLNLSSFNTEKVTNMAGMFNECTSLESLDLSNFNTQNVTNMSNMFEDCEALNSLNISDFDTKKVTDMSYMFYDCKSLAVLDLSSFDTSNVQTMPSIFNGCTNLTTIYVSNKFIIPESLSTIFYEAKKLTGMNGTICNDLNVNNSTYYKIDEGTTSPGFLSVNIDNLKLISKDYDIDNNNEYIVIGKPIDLTKITPSISFDVVKANNKINIVYNTLILKSYDIIDLSSLDVRNSNILFDKTKTVGELKTSLEIASLVIKDKEDNVKLDTSKLVTDDKLMIGSSTYTIVVKGDIYSDGKVDFMDVTRAYSKYKNKLNDATEAQIMAADVYEDDKVNFMDVTRIYQMYKKDTN